MEQKTVDLRAFRDDISLLLPFFELDGAPHNTLETYCSLFAETLEKEAEFSFASSGKNLEITIQNKGAAFHENIRALMKGLQISREDIISFEKINTLFPNTGTLMKVDFHLERESSISVYYQTQISLKMASSISLTLCRRSLPETQLQEIGKWLGRKGIYIGLDFAPRKSPALSLFYPIPPRKAKAPDRVLTLMDHLNRSERGIILNHHGALTEFISGDLFISFGLADDGSLAGMKIDYELVNIPLALRILKEAQVADEEIRRFLKIARALDTTVLSYFGIKFGKPGETSFKFYFKRVYCKSDNDEIERIASFLESSIWRFEE